MGSSLTEIQTYRLPMTLQQIEEACGDPDHTGPERHYNEPPALTLETLLFPLGFPMLIRTNSEQVLRVCSTKWGAFEKVFDTEPMETQIHVVESESQECPPGPAYHFLENMLLVTANAENVCVAQFPRGKTRMVISTAALAHSTYFSQTFLEAAAASQIWSRFATPIHAACVAIDGRGVLLCGDPGAGKTSLAYACARAGWQFVSDDVTYLLNKDSGRQVLGDCHQVRFRPSAVELFPEIAGAQITPRMFGKPSIELRTSIWPTINVSRFAHADFVVFLNRRQPKIADLVPYRKDIARFYMRQNLFAGQTKLAQHASIERLLQAEVLELRYQSLDWAVARLERLVREGC